MPTMASEIASAAVERAADPTVVSLAATLETLPRLAIDEEVCREVLALDIYHEDVLELWRVGRLRFPFDRFWVEIPARGVDPSWTLNMSRVGLVVEISFAERLSVSLCVQSVTGAILAFGELFSLTRRELRSEQVQPSEPSHRRMLAVLLEGMLFFSLHLGLLLTAKNAPLVFDPENDYSRLNRQRAKVGKPPVLGCRPIRWDLGAFERSTGRSPLPDERRRAVAHMVRGHMKFIRGTAHWWKPHYRCVDGGVSPSPRDYDVGRGRDRLNAA